MTFDTEKVIRGYLPKVLHLSLATSFENKPWCTEVHFVFDDELNLYFRSTMQRRHSQEIQSNKNVSGTIITQHALGQLPRGVYFEGVAEIFESIDENSVIYKLFCERLGLGPEILIEANSSDGHKFYKIAVENYYVFDKSDSEPSKKYKLSIPKAN
jgi:uncharacterized protein YhbP (UPF0306 family)